MIGRQAVHYFGVSLVVWVASYVMWPISFVVVKDKSLFLLRKLEFGDSTSRGGQSYYTMV